MTQQPQENQYSTMIMEEVLARGSIEVSPDNRDRFKYDAIKDIMYEWRKTTYSDLMNLKNSHFMQQLNFYSRNDYVVCSKPKTKYIKV
jgi:hypothetical protein